MIRTRSYGQSKNSEVRPQKRSNYFKHSKKLEAKALSPHLRSSGGDGGRYILKFIEKRSRRCEKRTDRSKSTTITANKKRLLSKKPTLPPVYRHQDPLAQVLEALPPPHGQGASCEQVWPWLCPWTHWPAALLLLGLERRLPMSLTFLETKRTARWLVKAESENRSQLSLRFGWKRSA